MESADAFSFYKSGSLINFALEEELCNEFQQQKPNNFEGHIKITAGNVKHHPKMT